MELPDINVLIYAHREDAPEHDRYAAWLRRLADGAEPFALSSFTLGGFLRIVTNPRIFDPATPLEVAIAFCEVAGRTPPAPSSSPQRRVRGRHHEPLAVTTSSSLMTETGRS